MSIHMHFDFARASLRWPDQYLHEAGEVFDRVASDSIGLVQLSRECPASIEYAGWPNQQASRDSAR
jgi:hypothetical protein